MKNLDKKIAAPAQDKEWRYSVLGLLETQPNVRVCKTADLIDLVRVARPGASIATARSAIEGLVAAKALQKISHGIYLNMRCTPHAEMGEVAPFIRHGAHLSLDSVLGDCGFLHNPPIIVTAVLPIRDSARPNVGQVRTSSGQVFRFNALPDRFFPKSPLEERILLQMGRFLPVFKPEAALLHWLHLANSCHSSHLLPPQDVDFSELDKDFIAELSVEWKMEKELSSFVKRLSDMKSATNAANASDGHPSARERSLAAKERLKSLRGKIS